MTANTPVVIYVISSHVKAAYPIIVVVVVYYVATKVDVLVVGSRLCEVTIHQINLRGANSRPVASRAIAHMESPRPLPAWSTSTLSVHLNTPVVIVKTLGSTAVIDPASMVWGMHIINLLPSPIYCRKLR